MKKLAVLLPVGLMIAACEGGMSSGMLPQKQFEETANFILADDIAQNCGRYETTITGEQMDSQVAAELRQEGYTAQEAQDMILNFDEDKFSKYRADYLDSLNVMTNNMSYCILGDRTRAGRPDVGQYLVVVRAQ